jgi:hypothetical protein
MSHISRLAAALVLPVLIAAPARAEGGFAPGEETVIEVEYLGLRTGEGRILVGRPEGEVWPVIFQARTEGVAGIVDIREHLTSYWDSTARTTRGTDLRAVELGDYHQDSARIDRAKRQATVTVLRKGKKKVKVVDVHPDVHDLTSAFMWLRLQPLAVGQRHDIPVLAGSKTFTLVAEVVGKEPMDTAVGRLDALKVRLVLGFDGKFSQRRDSFLWLSDDARRILLRAEAEFAVGALVATVRSYRPGGPMAAAGAPPANP